MQEPQKKKNLLDWLAFFALYRTSYFSTVTVKTAAVYRSFKTKVKKQNKPKSRKKKEVKEVIVGLDQHFHWQWQILHHFLQHFPVWFLRKSTRPKSARYLPINSIYTEYFFFTSSPSLQFPSLPAHLIFYFKLSEDLVTVSLFVWSSFVS